MYPFAVIIVVFISYHHTAYTAFPPWSAASMASGSSMAYIIYGTSHAHLKLAPVVAVSRSTKFCQRAR